MVIYLKMNETFSFNIRKFYAVIMHILLWPTTYLRLL